NLELLASLMTVLFEASMAPQSEHEKILERCFERGITHKLGAGRPYDEIAAVVTRERFSATGRESLFSPIEWRDAPVSEPITALARRVDPGPGYSREKALKFITNRYARCREILTHTLPRLATDVHLRRTYEELQERGWKDWHVLLALVNARVNFRNEQNSTSIEEMREQILRDPQHQAESSDEPPLPPKWLTIEQLEQMRKMAFLTGAQFWGLELHGSTPDLDALLMLLSERYGYSTDDVPHAPLLGEQTSSRSLGAPQ
ncbi:MAG TPA: hypothetical protein VID70_03590, partial [Solirubrobacteraceae bacterium]